jgi:IclR family acetate operon transcriptional repressor
MQVLATLADCDGLSLTDLSRQTGVSKSTMHNLLATLEGEGYVRRHLHTRRYGLGGALIPLGAAAARAVRTLTVAVERLPGLASEHGLSMAAVQLTPDGEAQVIERAYPPDPLHVGIRIGSRYGPFDGAIGKCLLAAMEPERASELVWDRPIPAHTERTLTSPGPLLDEVELVRERGWGASIAELNSNMAVAATIHGADGAPEAMLLAVGFPSQLRADEVPSVGAALSEEAALITVMAGGAVPVGGEEKV